MFIQTVIQSLLRKRKRVASEAAPTTEKELSPMAQSIMQKLAEHENNSVLGAKTHYPPKNEG